MKINSRLFVRMQLLALMLIAVGFGLRPAQAAPFDQAFIDAMVPHHMMAVDMAKLAAARAHHPELRRMAQTMLRDQNKEVAQMKQWRKKWFGSATVPMNHSMHHGSDTMMGLPMRMEMNMPKLRAAKGNAFDKMFLQMMIPHHAGAIMMAHEAITTSKHPELRRLSHQIMDSQAAEIGTMRTWHRRWFGPM